MQPFRAIWAYAARSFWAGVFLVSALSIFYFVLNYLDPLAVSKNDLVYPVVSVLSTFFLGFIVQVALGVRKTKSDYFEKKVSDICKDLAKIRDQTHSHPEYVDVSDVKYLRDVILRSLHHFKQSIGKHRLLEGKDIEAANLVLEAFDSLELACDSVENSDISADRNDRYSTSNREGLMEKQISSVIEKLESAYLTTFD